MPNREGEADILLQERMLENRWSPDDHIFKNLEIEGLLPAS